MNWPLKIAHVSMSRRSIEMRTLNKLLLLLVLTWILIFLFSCKATKSVVTTESSFGRYQQISMSCVDSIVMAAAISCDSVVISPLSVDSVGIKPFPHKIVYHGLRAKIEENNVSTIEVKDTSVVTKETKSKQTKESAPIQSTSLTSSPLIWALVLVIIVIFVRKIGR